MEIFECERYVDVLKLMLEQNSHIRGYNTRLAEAASCHSSHLSHVTAERVHLTPDQALAIADFWELAELQCDFFLSLVEYERAGTERLRKKLKLRMEDIRTEAKRFSGRNATKDDKKRIELSLADATTYCSHWYYCVIHCLVEVKAYRLPASIAEHLNLPLATVERVLDRLHAMELIRFDETDQEWRVAKGVKYTGPDDLLTLMNTSQRLFSAYRRELRNPEDLNITIVGAIRKSDIPTAREMLWNTLKEISKLNAFDENRENDSAIMLCCDLFEI